MLYIGNMKEFETKALRICLHENGLKEITVKKDCVAQPEDVWESYEQTQKLMPLSCYFVLLESEENSEASLEARRAVASEKYGNKVKALAVVSNRLAINILGNLFIKVNRPKVTTRFFEDRAVAVKWLEARMTEEK